MHIEKRSLHYNTWVDYADSLYLATNENPEKFTILVTIPDPDKFLKIISVPYYKFYWCSPGIMLSEDNGAMRDAFQIMN
jgi:hypothetical protein